MNDLVRIGDKGLTTTSKIICDVFGKVHRNVVRDIDMLDCSKEFKKKNFVDSFYMSSQNKKIRCYDLTLDGALFLCSGFTGKKSILKKEALISLFKGSVSFETVIAAINEIDIEDEKLFIYIAQESVSGRYKIGVSKNPEKRVKQLNIGNPEELVLVHKYKSKDGFKEESLIHGVLKRHSLRSEWFSADSDLNFLIADQDY